MAINNNEDWRILAYNGFMNGQIFEKEKFVSSEKNDHEHCEFCYKKITDLNNLNEEIDRFGYVYKDVKKNRSYWLCEECYSDFKERFNFKNK